MRDHVRSGRRRLISHSPLERKCGNGSKTRKNTKSFWWCAPPYALNLFDSLFLLF